MKSPQEMARQIVENVSKVLVGKETAVELALVALGCEGHVLMDDIPGVGKTMLAKALAISLGCPFAGFNVRLTFTIGHYRPVGL